LHRSLHRGRKEKKKGGKGLVHQPAGRKERETDYNYVNSFSEWGEKGERGNPIQKPRKEGKKKKVHAAFRRGKRSRKRSGLSEGGEEGKKKYLQSEKRKREDKFPLHGGGYR